MRRFTAAELERFLERVDAELAKPCTIVLIGGGAVGLKYKGAHATTDLDLWSVSEGSFWEAVDRANAATPERVPVQRRPSRSRRTPSKSGSFHSTSQGCRS